MEGEAARQGFRRLAQQVRCRAAEDQETGRCPRPVGQNSKHGKQLREPLDLVEDDEAPQRSQRQDGVGQAREVGGILQVERRPAAGHDRRTAPASVVLPACRGPRMATAGDRLSS